MTWLRALGPILLAVAVAWLVATGGACAADAGPQLVKVVDVAPQQVELGDRVVIAGDGFPPGQTARVTFEGTLHRPGERPVGGAQIVVTGTATSSEQVEVAFGELTQALFCGAGDMARHTTFEGSVEVAFAAAAPGAPPVAGVLARAVIDVRPSGLPSNASGDAEGARFLAWIGVHATPGATGLLVESVGDGSRAHSAGIEAGAVLATFDGVRVATLGDLVPPPGEREAAVGLRRLGTASEGARGSGSRWRGEDVVVRSVSVGGFRRAPPAELLAAALVVLAALAMVLLFAAPNPVMGSAVLQRVVWRVGARLRAMRGVSSARAKLARAMAAVAADALPPAGGPAVVDAVVCGLLAALPFGQYLVAAKLDVGVLFVAAAAAAASAAFVAGGSLLRGARSALEVVWQHVPASAAVASVVVSTGSLRVQEVERAQGGWPWDWLAFRSPATLVALALLLLSARVAVEGGERMESGSVASLVEDEGARPQRGPWLAAARRAHTLLVAGLASVLFLGGWLLPGLSPAEQDARPALELAGAAWLLAKTWGIAFAVGWVDWALPRARLSERTRATALWLVPLALLAFLTTAAWTWWSPARAEQLLVSGTLVAAVALAAMAVALRVRHGLRAASGGVSPFL